MLTIVTWNVNSIRSRMERVTRFIQKNQVDILCLQEIKATEEQFPKESLIALGYESLLNTQKTYNGVAILFKKGLKLKEPRTCMGFNEGAHEARFLQASLGHLKIINVYVPNGRSVGDQKFEYKLRWLTSLKDYLQENFNPEDKVMLMGDFNVAPEDRDCFDPEGWRESLLVSSSERKKYQEILDLGYFDTFRKDHALGGAYTWWDYRNLAFPMNRGLRIDHILCTTKVLSKVKGCEIDRNERKSNQQSKEKPSDHAPVILHIPKSVIKMES